MVDKKTNIDDIFLSESSGSDHLSENNLSSHILHTLKEFEWKPNVPRNELNLYTGLYNKISKRIARIPTVYEILKLSIDMSEKCDLIERLIVLYNTQPETMEFMHLRRSILRTIDSHKHYNITEVERKRYKLIEASLNSADLIEKPLQYRIFDFDIDLPSKSYIYSRYKHFLELDSSSGHYSKLKNWIDNVLLLPTKIKPLTISINDTAFKINKYLWNVRAMLDKEVYGMHEVKEKIICMLNVMINNPDLSGFSFALCGPPGIAKTTIINVLAKAIELPFFQINLAGANKSSFLVGHNYTYEGSTPGVIVQALQSMKYKNGIIYFDEIDKISETDQGAELSQILLHTIDPSQNYKFHDRYLSESVNVDLSKVIFLYSLNDRNRLCKTLCDRIPIIELPGYTKKEKIDICRKHIIPNILKKLGLSKSDVIFSDEAIRYIVEKSEKKSTTENKGMRQIKYSIENILMKINMLKTIYVKGASNAYKLKVSFNISNFCIPFMLTQQNIDILDSSSSKTDEYMHMYI